MSDQPSASPLTFPCRFPIKVMGLASDAFAARVVGIMRKHAPDLDEAAVERRASQGGKYLALTVTIQARDRAQLDAIYQELTACGEVLVAL